MILLASFMEGNADILKILRNEIEALFGECRILNHRLEIPKEAFDETRGQYDSRYFLDKISEDIGRASDKMVGITDADLYTQHLNFVFGQAILGGNACVVSLHRLDPEFYGQKNSGLFVERAIKEVVHELGHCFGLRHCTKKDCVMVFSNSILEVDHKTRCFCDDCEKIVGEAIDHNKKL
ncbi:MAG: archaemetzincin family Zn-dependent metalloprotease [Candidatus Hydrothermarchaeales archaeon]